MRAGYAADDSYAATYYSDDSSYGSDDGGATTYYGDDSTSYGDDAGDDVASCAELGEF